MLAVLSRELMWLILLRQTMQLCAPAALLLSLCLLRVKEEMVEMGHCELVLGYAAVALGGFGCSL